MLFVAVPLIVLGFFLPSPLYRLVEQAAQLIGDAK